MLAAYSASVFQENIWSNHGRGYSNCLYGTMQLTRTDNVCSFPQQNFLQWFRREAEERRQRDITFLTHLYNEVRDKLNQGTAHECLASQSILNRDKIGLTDLDLAYAVSSPFGAGIETVSPPFSCDMARVHLLRKKLKSSFSPPTCSGACVCGFRQQGPRRLSFVRSSFPPSLSS